MKFRSILLTVVLALPLAAQTPPKTAAPAAGPAPTRIAIIQFQQAVLSTQEGQAAAAGLKTKFDPKKAQLDQKQTDLKALQDKLQSGGATMTNDARTRMQNDIAAGGRALNHDVEDLNSEVQEEEGKIMRGMAGKMGEIIQGYAAKNGYSMVLDVSSEATPVLWATPSINITADIVKLYDQAHPAKAAPAPPAAKKP